MKNEDYILIGKIIENVQNIEYDLIQGIRFNRLLSLFEKYKTVSPTLFQNVENDTVHLAKEMQNMTFGQLMGIVRKYDFISNDDLDYLETILSKRNQLVHQYFKYNELNNSDEETKSKYLKRFYEESSTFSEYLHNIVLEIKNDLDNATGRNN